MVVNITRLTVWQFGAYFALGLIWIGLGVVALVQGLLLLGLFYLAFGPVWFVIGVLRRRGILPLFKVNLKPPRPNPYQEHLRD
jgi:hypothetical protein